MSLNQWQNGKLRPVYAPAGVHEGGVDRLARLPYDVMQWQEPGASVASEWVVSPPADSGQHFVNVDAGDALDDGLLQGFGFYDRERYILEPSRSPSDGFTNSVQDLHFFGPI